MITTFTESERDNIISDVKNIIFWDVTLVRTNVSEEHIASFFRVKIISKL
jgi:hypothetical protein